MALLPHSRDGSMISSFCFRALAATTLSLLFIIVDGGAKPASHSSFFNASSKKRLVQTAADHSWSLRYPIHTRRQKLHIKAFIVEFKPDTSLLTSGNGMLEMRGDETELRLNSKDTVYRYDHFPHDVSYFESQLQFVKNYYEKVSHGLLDISFEVVLNNDCLFARRKA
jgi:hypothetical protein